MGEKGTREARGKTFALTPDVGPDGKFVCLRAGSTEHPDCCEWVGETVLSRLSTRIWREFGYSPSRGHNSTPEIRVQSLYRGLRDSTVFGVHPGPLKPLLEFIECCETPKCTCNVEEQNLLLGRKPKPKPKKQIQVNR